jgi:hypothetical protein
MPVLRSFAAAPSWSTHPVISLGAHGGFDVEFPCWFLPSEVTALRIGARHCSRAAARLQPSSRLVRQHAGRDDGVEGRRAE